MLYCRSTNYEKPREQDLKINTVLKVSIFGPLFWSVFSRTRTKYREIQSIYPYSIRMGENTDQKTPNTGTSHAAQLFIYHLV